MKAAPEGVAMTKRKNQERPDFDRERAAVWLEQYALSADELRNLRKLLPKTMSALQKNQFIELIAALKPTSHIGRRAVADGEKKKQLQAVATQARRLLDSMANSQLGGHAPPSRQLSPAARITMDSLANDLVCRDVGIKPLSEATKAARRDGFLAPYFWDTVQDIETAFSFAAGQLKGSKQDRPTNENAKAFVSEVAAAYFNAMQAWPSMSEGKKLWFPDFANTLLGLAGFASVGNDLLQAGIVAAGKSD